MGERSASRVTHARGREGGKEGVEEVVAVMNKELTIFGEEGGRGGWRRKERKGEEERRVLVYLVTRKNCMDGKGCLPFASSQQ